MEFIRIPFGYLLEYLYKFTTNYGLSLILFSLIVKLILLPFAAKHADALFLIKGHLLLLELLLVVAAGDLQPVSYTHLFTGENRKFAVLMQASCMLASDGREAKNESHSDRRGREANLRPDASEPCLLYTSSVRDP